MTPRDELLSLRKSLGYTQAQMAEQLGMSARGYQDAEAQENPRRVYILAARQLLAQRAEGPRPGAENFRVGEAFRAGAMAALGCDPWDDACDFFALVGQDYAAGLPLPNTMPKPHAPQVQGGEALREKVARLVWFMFGDDMTATAAMMPENDAFWGHWSETDEAKSAWAAADEILALINPTQAQGGVPEGYVLVPREPTEVTHSAACEYADMSTDPLASMLREADIGLRMEPPDIIGALVNLHAARLAQAHRALAAAPKSEGE